MGVRDETPLLPGEVQSPGDRGTEASPIDPPQTFPDGWRAEPPWRAPPGEPAMQSLFAQLEVTLEAVKAVSLEQAAMRSQFRALEERLDAGATTRARAPNGADRPIERLTSREAVADSARKGGDAKQPSAGTDGDPSKKAETPVASGPTKGKSLWKKAQKSATRTREEKQDDGTLAKGSEPDNTMMSFTAVVNAEVQRRSGFHAQEEDEEIDESTHHRLLADAEAYEQEKMQVTGCIIMPHGQKRLFWDSIGMALILWLALHIPYVAAFSRDDGEDQYDFTSFGFVIDLFFVCDIFLNFCTAYYHKGRLITNHKRIVDNYLRTFFIIDLIASIPYDLVTSLVRNRYDQSDQSADSVKALRIARAARLVKIMKTLRIFRLLRLFRLKALVYKFEEAVQSQTITCIMAMGKYVTIMVFLAHWEACTWYAIGYPGRDDFGNTYIDEDNPTWVMKQSLMEKPFANEESEKGSVVRYICSLYWAFATMSTVGYGDIFPVNTRERVFAMVTMVVACGVFAMVVGGLQQVLAKFAEERQEFDRMLLRTMRYLRAQHVNRELQTKVKRYLEHNYDNKARTGMDPKLLANLSQTLKSEVLVALLMPIVKRFPLFQQSSRLFLVRVCTGCMTHRHAPGDVVCDAGTIATSMLFVVTGKLVKVKRGKENEDQGKEEYYEGYWIGELNLFTAQTRDHTVISVTFSELLEITQIAFQQTLKDFPNMLQTFQELKAKIKNGDTSSVEFVCTTCGRPGHPNGGCVSQSSFDEPKLHWFFQRYSPWPRFFSSSRRMSRANNMKRLPSSIMEGELSPASTREKDGEGLDAKNNNTWARAPSA